MQPPTAVCFRNARTIVTYAYRVHSSCRTRRRPWTRWLDENTRRQVFVLLLLLFVVTTTKCCGQMPFGSDRAETAFGWKVSVGTRGSSSGAPVGPPDNRRPDAPRRVDVRSIAVTTPGSSWAPGTRSRRFLLATVGTRTVWRPERYRRNCCVSPDERIKTIF